MERTNEMTFVYEFLLRRTTESDSGSGREATAKARKTREENAGKMKSNGPGRYKLDGEKKKKTCRLATHDCLYSDLL